VCGSAQTCFLSLCSTSYHGRDVLRANIISRRPDLPRTRCSRPREPRTCRHYVYVHIAASYRPRQPGKLFVLEDNARTPSGVCPTCGKPRTHDAAVSDLFAPPRRPVERIRTNCCRRCDRCPLSGRGRRRRWPRGVGGGWMTALRLNSAYLRAFISRRQARHRAGRGPRPHRQNDEGSFHHRGLKRADSSYLPPRR